MFANEVNATNRPSAEIDGGKLVSLPCVPCEATLTRLVLPALRSRTKMSLEPFMLPATRMIAIDMNATKLPSAEIVAAKLSPLSFVFLKLPLTPIFILFFYTTLFRSYIYIYVYIYI